MDLIFMAFLFGFGFCETIVLYILEFDSFEPVKEGSWVWFLCMTILSGIGTFLEAKNRR